MTLIGKLPYWKRLFLVPDISRGLRFIKQKLDQPIFTEHTCPERVIIANTDTIGNTVLKQTQISRYFVFFSSYHVVLGLALTFALKLFKMKSFSHILHQLSVCC